MVCLHKVAPLVTERPLVNAKEKLPHAHGGVQEKAFLALLPAEGEGVFVSVLEFVRICELVPKRWELFLHRLDRIAVQPLKPAEKFLLGVLPHHVRPHVPGDDQSDWVAGIHTEIRAELPNALGHDQILVSVLVNLVNLLKNRGLDRAVLDAFRENVLDSPLKVPVVRAQNVYRQALSGFGAAEREAVEARAVSRCRRVAFSRLGKVTRGDGESETEDDKLTRSR